MWLWMRRQGRGRDLGKDLITTSTSCLYTK